jgi:cardiolipin synthase (CMP-forming)
MTTANKITIVRILLVPFFIVLTVYYVQNGEELFRLAAIGAFALAALSDGIDGYIARHYHQHSELGRILDPLADKMLLIAGIILLSLKNEPYLERLPLWLTITVLSRDVLLLIGLVVIHHACGQIKVRPALVGKVATVLQMTCILWALLKWDARWLRTWAVGAALCTGISGVIYVVDGMRQLSTSPSSSPAPNVGD